MCAARSAFCLVVLSILLPARLATAQAAAADDSFYTRSLHFTTRGFAHWYAKEQGGPELITGRPFSSMGCGDCHVGSCDTCHRKEAGGKAAYSLEPARAEAACAKCHTVPTGETAKADVHASRGMTCMSCHTTREIHGDGTAYDTYAQPGAVQAKCENCHDAAKCEAFTVHRAKVDCAACHAAAPRQCHNCHLETKLRDKKSLSVPIENVLFLVNHEGRVTAGTFLSYAYGTKTMITFGRSFSHSVGTKARTCGDCHGTANVREVSKGAFQVVRWESGAIKSAQGVVPVLAGAQWNAVFLDRRDGQWVPLEKPDAPLIQYSAYVTPLTRAQIERMQAPQRPPSRP